MGKREAPGAYVFKNFWLKGGANGLSLESENIVEYLKQLF